jgi:hypothetical protein
LDGLKAAGLSRVSRGGLAVAEQALLVAEETSVPASIPKADTPESACPHNGQMAGLSAPWPQTSSVRSWCRTVISVRSVCLPLLVELQA